MTEERHDPESVVEPTVVRDRRRIDPETGQVREAEENAESDVTTAPSDPSEASEAGVAASAPGEPGDDALAKARAEAAERLDDLKRLQAEYVNYRRRVERDRELVRENVKAEILAELLSILDDIGRAREHGDLTGAFRAVGESLESVVAKIGLEQFGEAGDEFDPTIHEAFMHGYSDEVKAPTCTQILQPGYRLGERVIRPARVAVAEPTEALASSDDDGAASAAAGDTATDEPAGDPQEEAPAQENGTDETSTERD